MINYRPLTSSVPFQQANNVIQVSFTSAVGAHTLAGPALWDISRRVNELYAILLANIDCDSSSESLNSNTLGMKELFDGGESPIVE